MSFVERLVDFARGSVKGIEADIEAFLRGNGIAGDKWEKAADMTDTTSGLMLQEMYAGKQASVAAPSAIIKGEKETVESSIQRLT